MKICKNSIYNNSSVLPRIKFQDQQLTSFAGLVIIKKFFCENAIVQKIAACCRHLSTTRFYNPALIIRILMIHILLGYRKLGDIKFYEDDPMVKSTLELSQLPSPATISRVLAEFDDQGVAELQRLMRTEVIGRIHKENFKRLTLDFDGSVLSCRRHAEGTAVGFNKKKKGLRSYYPLMCTLAQTGQVFDVLHRSGNIHDSNGALEFIGQCLRMLKKEFPKIKFEVRMDSAFYSQEIITMLRRLEVEFTISVPFERFLLFKKWINERRRWFPIKGSQGALAFFEYRFRPQSWSRKARFIFIRKECSLQRKQPIQLDLFEPKQLGYEFKVIITNKKARAKSVVRYHEGRGYQESIYAELKSGAQMEYIPCKKWVANKIFLLANFLTHNYMREMQMSTRQASRSQTEKRTVRWIFEGMASLRKKLIQRAGKLTCPQGHPTLTMSKNAAVQEMLDTYL